MKVEVEIYKTEKETIEVDFPLFLKKTTKSYSEFLKISSNGKIITLTRYLPERNCLDINIDVLKFDKELSIYLDKVNYDSSSKEEFEKELSSVIINLKE